MRVFHTGILLVALRWASRTFLIFAARNPARGLPTPPEIPHDLAFELTASRQRDGTLRNPVLGLLVARHL